MRGAAASPPYQDTQQERSRGQVSNPGSTKDYAFVYLTGMSLLL